MIVFMTVTGYVAIKKITRHRGCQYKQGTVQCLGYPFFKFIRSEDNG